MIFLKKLLLLFSRWVVSDSFVTPWTVAHQAPLSVGFPRQGYWSGLSFPSPGGFLTLGWNLSLLLGRWILHTTEPPGKPLEKLICILSIHFCPLFFFFLKNIFTLKNTFNWKKVHLQRRGKDSTEHCYIPLPQYLPLLTLYTTTVHSPKLGNPQWHITIS